jgi:hypothetical protein
LSIRLSILCLPVDLSRGIGLPPVQVGDQDVKAEPGLGVTETHGVAIEYSGQVDLRELVNEWLTNTNRSPPSRAGGSGCGRGGVAAEAAFYVALST